MKKALRFTQTIMAVALGLLVSASFTSCGDDDNEPDNNSSIYGYWVCESEDGYTNDFSVGTGMAFFDSSFTFTSNGKKVTAKKCLRFYPEDDLSQINVAQWDKELSYYDDGDAEFDRVYIVQGNTLAILEHDLDSYVGTFEINGDEMTWTCRGGSYLTPDEDEVCVTKLRRVK